MAYPTAKSNDREGGSPSKAESERTADYMDETKDIDDPENDHDEDDKDVGEYVDRKHPHQDSEDRQTGDHPHKHLTRY